MIVIECDNLTYICGDFIFGAVDLLCAVNIVAGFYTVQYEHMKRDVVDCAFAFVPNFLEYVSAKNYQNWMTSDQVITNIKRVTFFSETWCILVCMCNLCFLARMLCVVFIAVQM